MRHVYIFAAMAAGVMAGLSITSKQEHTLTAQVTTDYNEMEAIWYPE